MLIQVGGVSQPVLYNDDEVIKLKFEENLREARKQYGYSQEELADKLNVSRQAVSKCTKGAQSGKMEVPILSWTS